MSNQYERKIILVGKTGNGKSSLGNVLVGRKAFSEACGFSAVTKECQMERKEKYIAVVDTPGLFDSDKNKSLFKNAFEIQKAVELCPKPHAFLIVLNGMTRLTEEEMLTIDVLRIIFGEQCLTKAVIVFTHIENTLDPNELKREIENCSEMKYLIEQCGGRYARIDNSRPTPKHKDDIFKLVDKVSENGTDYFKNEYLDIHKQKLKLTRLDSKPVHDQIKQLCERILQAVEEMRRQQEEEEARRQQEERRRQQEEAQTLQEERDQRLKNVKQMCVAGICIFVVGSGGAVALICAKSPPVVAAGLIGLGTLAFKRKIF